MKNDDKYLVSICVPVLNEFENLDSLYSRLVDLANVLSPNYDFEFVFTDNASNDGTWQKVQALAASDSRVRGARFSRNFGFQNSILAAFRIARGDAVVQLDADLQDPPELIVTFLEKWAQGAKVVYGIRSARKENLFIAKLRSLGYGMISSLSEYPIPQNAGDFRLVDRAVVQLLIETKVADPYIRGLIPSYGFPQVGVPYGRDSRKAGRSKFSLGKLLSFGTNAVLNHSVLPLRAASMLGLVVLLASAVATVVVIVSRLSEPNTPQGFASIASLLLFGIGINSLFLGVIGEYLLKVLKTVNSEPKAIALEYVNLDQEIGRIL